MTTTDLRVTRLESTEVNQAFELSQRAGWRTRRNDWQRMVDLETIDAFAGRRNEEIVATATLVRYEPRVGWIGMMLVRPDLRRQGYGTRMLQACLDAATSADLDIVGLDANPEGKPLYAKHDFVEIADVTQWRGSLPEGGSPNRVCSLMDPDVVAEFDQKASGVDRGFLLKSFLADEKTQGIVRYGTDSDVVGYALVIRRPPGWTVGPLLADSVADGRALLQAARNRINNTPITVNTVGNPKAKDCYREYGFDIQRSLTRMTYQDYAEPLISDRIWSSPAFEYG